MWYPARNMNTAAGLYGESKGDKICPGTGQATEELTFSLGLRRTAGECPQRTRYAGGWGQGHRAGDLAEETAKKPGQMAWSASSNCPGGQRTGGVL